MFKQLSCICFRAVFFLLAVFLLSSCDNGNNTNNEDKINKQQVVISEFMASNDSVLATADGAYEDWIELNNLSSTQVNLEGWCLTDVISDMRLWCFPSISIEAGGYLVVFASKDDVTLGNELHTNFKLSKGGEYLALSRPDGSVAYEYATQYPEQISDVSYGLDGAGEQRYFPEATPNALNKTTVAGLLVFSQGSVSLDSSSNEFSVDLSTLGGGNTNYQLTVDSGSVEWLSVTTSSNEVGNTSVAISISADAGTFSAGTYKGVITVTASNYQNAKLDVIFTVNEMTNETGVDAIIINEFMASNAGSLATAKGDFEDWIELNNTGSASVDLEGWCLTDEASDVSQWCFPSVNIDAGGYLVIFASKDDVLTGDELHTNFKLKTGGEYLALSRPDGTIVDEYSPEYPPQTSDNSYGKNSVGIDSFLQVPTPGTENADSLLRLLEFSESELNFSVVSNGEQEQLLVLSTSTQNPISYSLGGNVGSADWLFINQLVDVDGKTADSLVVTASAGNLAEGTYQGIITATAIGYAVTKIEVNLTIIKDKVDTSVLEWDELNFKLNDFPLESDDVDSRLFYSIGSGFSSAQDHEVNVSYDSAQGYAIGINNEGIITNDSTYVFKGATYASEASVQLYKNNVLQKDYKLIFSNLPIIMIKAETILDEPKNPGIFRLSSEDFSEVTGVLNMGIEIRGASSQSLPKKAYAIEFTKTRLLEDTKKVKFFDLRKDDDWILDPSYRDTSFVRNLVSHDLWNAMQGGHAFIDETGKERGQATIKGQLTEVLLNNQYQGIHLLEEKIDRAILDLTKIKVPKDNDGNKVWNELVLDDIFSSSVLYKAQSNFANLIRSDLGDIKEDFEQKYPKKRDVEHWEPLQDLITFIVRTSREDFVSEVSDRVDIDNLVDFWLLYAVTQSTDTFNKNYYLARNEGQKFFFIPWDFDAAFGMEWDGREDPTTDLWQVDKNVLYGRLFRFPEIGFEARIKTRWNELKDNILSEDAILARFEGYHKQLRPVENNNVNAFERNLSRWPDTGHLGKDTPEIGTTQYVRAWLKERLSFVDAQIQGE